MRISILSNGGLFIVGLILFGMSYSFANKAVTGVDPVEWYIVASAFTGLIGMVMYLELLAREPEEAGDDESNDDEREE